MLNEVTLIGNVGSKKDLVEYGDDGKVINFSLATSHGYGDRKKTTWHRVVAFGKTAEAVDSFVQVGSKVCVRGRIDVREYEKDGEKRYSTEIISERVVFLDSKKDSEKQPTWEKVTDQIPF